MSRIKIIQKEQAPPEVKEIYDRVESNRAQILNLHKVIANSPQVLLNFLRLGNTLLTRAELSPKLRELAVMRVAKLVGSEYEWVQHYPIALGAGVSREQIEAIPQWQDSASFKDIERIVLQYTDEVAQNAEVKDETFSALRQHLNEQSIIELTLSVGYWEMVARFLIALDIDIDAEPISSAQEAMGQKS